MVEKQEERFEEMHGEKSEDIEEREEYMHDD